MRAWQFVLSGIVSFVNFTDVVLTAELSKAVRGFAFSADIKGTIGDDNFFQFQVEFDTKKISEFLSRQSLTSKSYSCADRRQLQAVADIVISGSLILWKMEYWRAERPWLM